MTGRIGESGVADDRRAGHESDQSGREAERGADARVAPLGQEPRKARGDEQSPEEIPSMPSPEDQPDGRERPTRTELDHCSERGGTGKGAGRVVTRPAQREQAEDEREQGERKPTVPAELEPF